MSKRKELSNTTPGHKMLIRSWLAELVMLRQHATLPAYFWRDTRWKWNYMREVKAISKFIKNYGELAVVSIACDRHIKTFSNYGNIEFLLQNEKAKIERLNSLKDLSPIISEATQVTEDLREPRSFIIRKSLFERLEELENG